MKLREDSQLSELAMLSFAGQLSKPGIWETQISAAYKESARMCNGNKLEEVNFCTSFRCSG